MKQLLFLLLFPCLALAQYPGNAGQKITLGEQTTADGLVWRGVASIDTVTATSKITRANKQDTSAYILLDTVTNLLWHYKIGSNGWIQAGGSTLDTATMLLPYYRAGRNTIIQAADVPTLNQNTTGSAATLTTGRTIQTNLASTSAATFNGSANITPGITGTLGGANGGTGLTTFGAAQYIPYAASPTTLKTNSRFRYDDNSFSYSMLKLDNTILDMGGSIRMYGGAQFAFYNESNNYGYSFSTPANSRTWILQNYNAVDIFVVRGPERRFGIAYNFQDSALITQTLSVQGNVRITAVGALGGNSATLYRNSDGVLSTTSSDINKKHNVRPIIYGLSTINQLNPVNFQWNVDESEDIGFIAQDIQNIIPESIETDWDSNLIFKYEKLIPILTKAIQEQNALIKALEQRILNLENK